MFFFTARDGSLIYMGKDKFENELLIKYGLPEDVWFHVDNMSSAHVYLRRKRGMNSLETHPIDAGVLEDCAQLVKHNSIKGRKMPAVHVSYTMWSNLKKTNSMEAGQVGFTDYKALRKTHVERDREVVRRLLKTMEERYPDLAAEKEARVQLEQSEARAAAQAKRDEEERAIKEAREKAKLQSYESLFKDFGDSDSDSDSSSDGDKTFQQYEESFM